MHCALIPIVITHSGHSFVAWHTHDFQVIVNTSLQDLDYDLINRFCNGPLARYIKLQVAHAPEIPGTFFSPPQVSDPDMHHGTCVTHVPWCMPGSLTSSFLWSPWRGKRSRHSRRMRNPQFYVSGERHMGPIWLFINVTGIRLTKSISHALKSPVWFPVKYHIRKSQVHRSWVEIHAVVI